MYRNKLHEIDLGVITRFDKKFTVIDPCLPRKPLALLTVRQARGKLVLNVEYH